ncbi:MAG: HNH endonuclease [Chloroflexi bacterium]|nr:HNH endonuclease [Chloroflexota bacterium]
MVIDHIVPSTASGTTMPDNLCLTCVGCNLYKSDFQDGVDPESQELVALFNPRLQPWYAHFNWEPDGTILRGLTPIGRATVARLRINRPEAVQSRQLWVQAGWHPPQRQSGQLF